jgi:hypothetical protein
MDSAQGPGGPRPMLVEHACGALVPDGSNVDRSSIGMLLLTACDQHESVSVLFFGLNFFA